AAGLSVERLAQRGGAGAAFQRVESRGRRFRRCVRTPGVVGAFRSRVPSFAARRRLDRESRERLRREESKADRSARRRALFCRASWKSARTFHLHWYLM